MWLLAKTLALKFAGPIFNLIKPMLAPLFAYFKGRSDGKRDAELKSRRHHAKIVNRVVDARDKSKLNRVPDNADPNNRD